LSLVRDGFYSGYRSCRRRHLALHRASIARWTLIPGLNGFGSGAPNLVEGLGDCSISFSTRVLVDQRSTRAGGSQPRHDFSGGAAGLSCQCRSHVPEIMKMDGVRHAGLSSGLGPNSRPVAASWQSTPWTNKDRCVHVGRDVGDQVLSKLLDDEGRQRDHPTTGIGLGIRALLSTFPGLNELAVHCDGSTAQVDVMSPQAD
jgi:hypothetical protein